MSVRVTPDGPAEVYAVGQALNEFARVAEQAAATTRARSTSDWLIRQVSSTDGDLDVGTLLSITVDEIGPALACDQAIVLLVTDDLTLGPITAEWVAAGVRPLGAGTQLDPPPSLATFVEHELGQGTIITIDDIEHDDRLPDDAVAFFRQYGVCALVVAPIGSGEQISGLLSLHSLDRTRHWTQIDRYVAASVAGELGVALRLGELFEHERRMVQELQQLDEAKSDFISSVSHELRTPLTSIIGYTEMLVDGDAGDLTQRQQSMMAVVDRNARRLLLLIDDLLTMSRIDADRLVLTPSETPVQQIVGSAVEAMQPLADAAGLTLSTDLDGAGVVFADEHAIERVLLNLLSNAVKFTPAGGAITVAAAPGVDTMTIAVADTGLGIPADEQSQLFTRFFRSSISRQHAVQGTGLGLAIVRHLVAAHGGSVDVESTPGQGTRIAFTLPMKPEEE